jgi:hypothetical protein
MQEYAAIHSASTEAQPEPSSNLESSSSVVQPTTSQEPLAKKAKLFSFMDSPSQTSQLDHDDAFDMHQELMDFCKAKLLDYNSDPLIWWKSHASEFPKLARMAKTALSIPASSAPVERIFSTAGKIFRPERTRLTSEKFETLVFIKCNKGLY